MWRISPTSRRSTLCTCPPPPEDDPCTVLPQMGPGQGKRFLHAQRTVVSPKSRVVLPPRAGLKKWSNAIDSKSSQLYDEHLTNPSISSLYPSHWIIFSSFPKKKSSNFQSAFSPPKNGLHDLGLLGCSSWSGGRTLGGSLKHRGVCSPRPPFRRMERSLEPWGLEKPYAEVPYHCWRTKKRKSHELFFAERMWAELLQCENCGWLMPWT